MIKKKLVIKNPAIKNNKAFTLVELMVTVSIVGILAAVAIPKYQAFQITSRQKEALLALAAVNAAESAYLLDSQSYTACLGDIGYSFTPTYYSVGFSSAAASTSGTNCGPAGGLSCYQLFLKSGAVSCTATSGANIVPATAALGAGGKIITSFTGGNDSLNTSSFCALAEGWVGGTAADWWHISSGAASARSGICP